MESSPDTDDRQVAFGTESTGFSAWLREQTLVRRAFFRVKAVSDPFPYRRYMVRHRSIFIHIPKCCGTSILQTLAKRSRPRDHFDYRIYRQADPERFKSYYKFAFVRHPLGRLQSLYKYLSGGGNGKSDLAFSETIRARYPSFDAFVDQFLEPVHLQTIAMLRPQVHYLYDGIEEKMMVDFLGRHEDFEADCRRLYDHLGVSSPVLKTNVSRQKDVAASDTTVAKIRSLYATDYEMFNYE